MTVSSNAQPTDLALLGAMPPAEEDNESIVLTFLAMCQWLSYKIQYKHGERDQ